MMDSNEDTRRSLHFSIMKCGWIPTVAWLLVVHDAACFVSLAQQQHQQQARTVSLSGESSTDDGINGINGNVEAASTNNETSERPANMIDQKSFVEGVETLLEEVKKQQAEATTTTTTEEPPQPDNDGREYSYALGRFEADIPINPPELDLIESPTGLVLVSQVWGKTAETTPIQALDTIVGITVGEDFARKTTKSSLEETATTLQEAAQHAMEKGVEEISLELNRLIKGYYG